MKDIDVKTLKPGLIFSKPVYIEGNNFLVPAGVAIRKKDIDRLIAWGIEHVSTDGDVIEGKDSSAGSKASETPDAESHKKANKFALSDVQENTGPYRSYNALIDKLDAVFTAIDSGNEVEPRSVDNICNQLLQNLRNNRDNYVGFILGGEVSGQELAKSSVNTAILSALIGQELKLPHHKIMQIVTGALIHDVGMLKLPKDILNKKGQLSDAELTQVKSHPLHTSKIITREFSYLREINLIALQHHERWDGMGYPEQLKENDIDLGARIVSVADAFEAMVSKKAYRNSMVGYQAVKNLLADNSRRFDPDIIKIFAKLMGIYPIGSIVLLNNGAYGRIIEVHSDAVLRPKIKILIDEFGKSFKSDEGEIIDLLVVKNLFIKTPVDPEEFAKANA